MTEIDVSILISLVLLLQIETEVGNPISFCLYTGWMNCDNNKDNENNNDDNKLLFTRGNQQ